jgi:hypothetical protein
MVSLYRFFSKLPQKTLPTRLNAAFLKCLQILFKALISVLEALSSAPNSRTWHSETTCGGESILIGFGLVGTFRSYAKPIGGGGGGSDVMGSGPRGTFRSIGKCLLVAGGGGESDVMGSGPQGTFLSTANCAVEGSISITCIGRRSADDALVKTRILVPVCKCHLRQWCHTIVDGGHGCYDLG